MLQNNGAFEGTSLLATDERAGCSHSFCVELRALKALLRCVWVLVTAARTMKTDHEACLLSSGIACWPELAQVLAGARAGDCVSVQMS